MPKETIRKQLLAQRAALSTTQVQALGEKAQSKLIESQLWQQAQTIALYMPIRQEMPTEQLLQNAWKHNKKVFLPCTSTVDSCLCINFLCCTSPEDVKLGKFAIPEPKDSCTPLIEKLDLLLIPGVAFDKKGYRIGYGAGCYDRYLAAQEEQQHAPLCLGFCYGFQLHEELPHDPWDKITQAICTEEGILWINKEKATHSL